MDRRSSARAETLSEWLVTPLGAFLKRFCTHVPPASSKNGGVARGFRGVSQRICYTEPADQVEVRNVSSAAQLRAAPATAHRNPNLVRGGETSVADDGCARGVRGGILRCSQVSVALRPCKIIEMPISSSSGAKTAKSLDDLSVFASTAKGGCAADLERD